MGVKGLWQLLEPVGRPVSLESLEGKILSVDASILLNQAVKGMRDRSGQPVPNAHLVVLFNRLCKLLYYRIRPVFVFDGGVPVLKKKTLAARKERKFKARYGSHRAAEKLVKNYLKEKALSSVTGRQSGGTIFKNKIPKEPDVFELPALSEKQSETKSTHSSGDEEDDVNGMSLVEEFYSQHNFENKYQDPSMINVNSEDFRSLPEEIQHEIIKDKIADKKLTQMDAIPQNAFNFSEFQLQSVLKRGKLHQRLDELRKTMNSRNTGEIAALSSQDVSGAECSVQSSRIVSEDTGHYILVKTTKHDNYDDDAETSTTDNSTEGGFLHDNQPQPTKQHPIPSFVDVDIDHSSDSEITSPLLDVPEVHFPSSWTSATQSQKAPDKVGENRQGERADMKEILNAENGIANKEKIVPYIAVNSNLGDNIITSSGMVEKGTASSNIGENVASSAMTEKGIKTSDMREKGISSSLIGEKEDDSQTTQEIDSQGNIMESQGLENIDNTFKKLGICVSYNNQNQAKKQVMELEQLNCSSEGSEQQSFIEVDDDNDAEIKQRKAHIESLLKSRQEKNTNAELSKKIKLMIEVEDSGHEVHLQQSENITENVTDDVNENTKLPLDLQDTLDNKEMDNTADAEREELPPESQDSPNNFVLRVEVSDDEDDNDNLGNAEPIQLHEKEPVLFHEKEMGKDDESCVITMTTEEDREDNEENKERPVDMEISEFAGTSKEDLEVIQRNLEQEQSSLQHEQARQARAAASVSSEMLNESQELLRLFGIPFLVSPMEAEAQCAFLDLTNQTHGTITDDSDVFLFGGRRVYKHLFNQNKHPELYTSDSIRGGFALDRSKLIKLALITGSDYTEGIQGLGAVGAMEVLQEFNCEGFEALLKFKKWYDDTKNNKQKTQETKVKKKLRTINLPTGFPSREVFDSYINPVIDESRGTFEWAKPDLHSLRLFAQEKLGWSANKADELLLPVMKQLNKEETQKKLDSFLQIKFQETRKKSSQRVRRVVNRFFNPNPLSDESSSDDELKANNTTDKQRRRTKVCQKNNETSSDNDHETNNKTYNQETTGSKGKGKTAGSRKKEATRSRMNDAGSRTTRGRKPGSKKAKGRATKHDGTFDQDLLFDSDGEFERLITDELIDETSNNLDKLIEVEKVDPDLANTDKFNEASNVNDVVSGSTNLKESARNQERFSRRKKVTDVKRRQKVGDGHSPECNKTPAQNHERIHLQNVPVNPDNEQLQAGNSKENPQNYSALTTTKKSISKPRGSSHNSSTSSDTDSEEERKFHVANFTSNISIGVSGVGRKRPKGKGGRGVRGRGKRPKTFY